MQDNVTEWVKNVEKFITDTEIEQDIMGKHVPIKKQIDLFYTSLSLK